MVQAKVGKKAQRHFANIGTHKMWGSGGIEVNWSPGIIGHSAFAERELFAAKFDTERGPVVRTYEFDRFNHTTFQVDWFVEDDVLYMHPKVVNNEEPEQKAYWWTCVANPVGTYKDSEERIISPVDYTAQTETNPTRYSSWPYLSPGLNSSFAGKDGAWFIDHSWQSNVIWGDYFFDIKNTTLQDPWVQISYLKKEDKGYSVWHGHGNDGTKFFTWGNNANSVFMQSFLGNFQPNSNYVELQTGLMKTQSQQAILPAKKDGGILEWTEYFKGWMPNNDEEQALKSEIYAHAINVTQDWATSERGIPMQKRKEIDGFLKSISSRPITRDEVIAAASPWGALHNKLLNKFGLPTLPTHTFFFYNETDKVKMAEVQPWDELLTQGTFSPQTLQAIPITFQTSRLWRDVLEESIAKYGATWLHLFHLSVQKMEEGAVNEPKVLLKQSLSLKQTPHAWRNLALLQETEEAALEMLLKAWDLALDIDRSVANRDRLVYYLGSEIASFLQSQGLQGKTEMREQLRDFIEVNLVKNKDRIPADLFTTDQVQSSQLAVDLWNGRPEKVLESLSDDSKNCYPTYGRQRSELNDYWNNANLAIAEKEKGHPLSFVEQRQVIMTKFAPRRVGCAYASWYSLNPNCWNPDDPQ
eukprot:UN04055